MEHARVLGVCCALAVCGALTAGCTDGDGGRGGSSGAASGSPRASASAAPGAEAEPRPVTAPTVEADPAKLPGTADEARTLIRKVLGGPEMFGSKAVRGTPYESDPSRWAVLGEDCVWQREELPDDVLATLTRHYAVPAAGRKGEARMSATVTVHRTALDAAWEQAGMLEEALGCEEQTLSEGERLTGLTSQAQAGGEGANNHSDDMLYETGACVSDTRGGPYPYWWNQLQLGPVVVSTSVCGGRGQDEEELNALAGTAGPMMMVRVQDAIGRPVGDAGEDSKKSGESEDPGEGA
ncbi:hypothetical protein [Streptomyces sp. NPDC006997]|uniref:hypothetical protein n=1 Tax=Streptomyces sp. NPDC006997 TaxID=3155356 RepID=UPI0033C16DE1